MIAIHFSCYISFVVTHKSIINHKFSKVESLSVLKFQYNRVTHDLYLNFSQTNIEYEWPKKRARNDFYKSYVIDDM